MVKKGQVSAFLLIGSLILIASATFFFIRSDESEISIKPPEKMSDVYTFIDSCFDDVSRDAVFFVSFRGGIYDFETAEEPEDYLATSYTDVPYYFDDGNDTKVSLEEIERNFSAYVQDKLNNCIGNLSQFNKKGRNVSLGQKNITAKITKNKVTFRMDLPTHLTIDDEEITHSDYYSEIDVNFKDAYSIAERIVMKQLQSPSFIDFDFITDFSTDINMVSHNKDTIVYIIHHPESDYKKRPFMLAFATRYHTKENSPPKISPLEEFYKIHIHEMFKENVDATDLEEDPIRFSDNTYMFDINPITGLIEFTPSEFDRGPEEVIIEANDGDLSSSIETNFFAEYKNFPPTINIIPLQYGEVGKQFEYQIHVQDPDSYFLTYSDDSDLFEINPITGRISFTPQTKGEYISEITVSDEAGNTAKENIRIIIS